MIGKLTTEEFKVMWYARATTARIAAAAGVHHNSITSFAERIGLPSRGATALDTPRSPATMEERISGDVEYILQEIMQRRNYTAATRDDLQAALERVVTREIRAFCKPKGRAA